jgi:hypothetical protein
MVDLDVGLRVLRVICRHTIEQPVRGAVIEQMIGVDTRTVSDVVSIAVCEGVPVGSCGRGYYKYRTRAERETYIHTETARLKSLGRKLSAIKRNSENDLSVFEQEEEEPA